MKILTICLGLFLVSGTFASLAASLRTGSDTAAKKAVATRSSAPIAQAPKAIRVILASPYQTAGARP